MNWFNNQKQGKATWYHDNGKVASIYPYQKGNIDGEVINYQIDGLETSRITYKNNHIVN